VPFVFGTLLLIFHLIASTYPARFKKQIKFPSLAGCSHHPRQPHPSNHPPHHPLTVGIVVALLIKRGTHRWQNSGCDAALRLDCD